MSYFQYIKKQLHCEASQLKEIATAVGTPCFVYSRHAISDNFRHIHKQFLGVRDFLLCYAVKANANPKILEILVGEGAGADVVSGGELFLALKSGFPPEKIVYAGVGKTDDEIDFALQNDILSFNVESIEEIYVINEKAKLRGRIAPISLRINADIDIAGHPFITTGKSDNKFGIDMQEVKETLPHILGLSNVRLVGLHCHSGSQVFDHQPYLRSLGILNELKADLASDGRRLEFIDIGGGLGVDYHADLMVQPKFKVDLLMALMPALSKVDCQVIFEPGRAIVADSGALLTRVLYNKKTRSKHFVIVDAGMTELIRPSLYDAYHQILPVEKRVGGEQEVDIVGPICESTDFLAKRRLLPKVERGDLLAVLTTGAYGYALASNYNSRLRPPEVLVDDSNFEIIREREPRESLLPQ